MAGVEMRFVVTRLGGVASRAQLVRATSRREVDRAIADGVLKRLARGRYGLPVADELRVARARVNGVIGGLSAASLWDWKRKLEPERPVVIVPRGRKLTAERRSGLDVRWATLPDAAIHAGDVTTPLRTALDCACWYPLDEAVAVLDSALRSPLVTRAELLAAAYGLPKCHRRRALRAIEAADPRAENPFESVIRVLASEVPGLHLVPQQRVPGVGTPDLYDEELGLIVECESFEFHGRLRADLKRDCERYNAAAIGSHVVLRFVWEHAMFEPGYVRGVLSQMVLVLVPRRTAPARSPRPAA